MLKDRELASGASNGCGASRVGSAVWLAALVLACAGPPEPAAGLKVTTAPPPSRLEEYCAWYGDAREGVLYFGQAAFWSAFRARGGDPRGDLAAPGPQQVGRFDLTREVLLEPLDVGTPGARSGVWDVHAHENGRVYFTTFYESMGAVTPATGAVVRFPELGLGLNEIAPGPDGTLLVTRYGAAGADASRRGSIVVITPEGELVAEHPLEPPAGYTAAPKTPAFDPASGELWTTADLIPDANGAMRYAAYRLSPDGALLRRVEHPEIQFVASTPAGALLRVASRDGALVLQRGAAEPQLLASDFVASLDFAQDLKLFAGEQAVVTRWSGWVHLAGPGRPARSLRLPSLDDRGLYYTAVVTGGRVCATYCAGVRVVCTDAP